jgi:hypothetical protein
LLFVLLTHHTYPGIENFEPLPEFLLAKNEMPTDDRLYTYLHASDAYVYYGRIKIDGIGVASCVAACLGAGRPILVPGYCNFFDISGKEIIKYNDYDEMEQRLRDVFEGLPYVREHLQAAEKYATVNSAPKIAEQFINLFDRVLDKSVHTASAARG